MSSPFTQRVFKMRRMEKRAKGREDMVMEEKGEEWKGRNEERVKRRIDEKIWK